MATPNSYKDSFWTDLASQAESKVGLPKGLLVSILTNGEKSNADQVSEAGARTPFQIIPQTRKALIDKYGIDPYLNPQNAAEGAARLLKESLDRNGGKLDAAVGEYHGGTNRENWGPINKAYRQRVLAGLANIDVPSGPNVGNGGSTFAKAFGEWQAKQNPQASNQLAAIYSAYKSGKMSPEEAADYEADVSAGKIMLPRGGSLNNTQQQSEASPQTSGAAMVLPQAVAEAYSNGTMTRQEKIDLERDVASGLVKLPEGVALQKTEPLGVIGGIREAITGNERKTATTEALPDWGGMPELNDLSVAGFKTGLGTLLSSPQETAQIIKANYPGVEVRQDEHGNFIMRSSMDGKEYAIKPGFQVSDIPRAAGGILAFTPAGRAESLVGAGLKSAATQATIEGTQAATGGNFDAKDVAVAGLTGVVVPAAIQGVKVVAQAVKSPVQAAVSRVMGRGAAEAPGAAPAAAPAGISPVAEGVVSPAAAARPVAPEMPSFADLPQTAKEDAALAIFNKDAYGKTAPYMDAWEKAGRSLDNFDEANILKTLEQNASNLKFKIETLNPKEIKNLSIDGVSERSVSRNFVEKYKDMLNTSEAPPILISRDASGKPFVVEGGHRLQAAKEAGKPIKAIDIGELLNKSPDELFSTAPKVTVSPAAAVQPAVAPVEQMTAQELAQTAKKAAEGGLGAKKATQVLAEQAAPDAKTVAAAERLGISEYLQPDHVTTNQAYRELAQAVKSIPGSEARSAELQGLSQVAKRADDLITEIGGSHDLAQVSSGVKQSLQATAAELEAQANKLYKQLREGIPAQAEAPAPTVLKFIEQRAEDLGGRQNLSSVERMIQSKLAPKQLTNEAGEVIGTRQPTYALLDDVRRDLTAARIKAQGPFKDADSGLIKKLEAELKTDQRAVVDRFGMSGTFDTAQKAVAVRKGLEDDLVSLFGKNLDGSIVGNLSGAVRALPSGDVSKFINLIKTVPENMRQETVASGLATAFGKSAKQGNINFNSYVKWYEGLLKNKQAYAALMSNLPPAARKQLSDLYRVSKSISLATKERITTGRIQAVTDELKGADSLLGNIYSLAKRSAVGAAAEVVTTPLGMPGAGISASIASALTKGKPSALKAADALISSPEFVESVKQAAKGNTKQAALKLAYSKPFIKFARAVGNPKEMSNRERWILQAIEANSANQRQSNQR